MKRIKPETLIASVLLGCVFLLFGSLVLSGGASYYQFLRLAQITVLVLSAALLGVYIDPVWGALKKHEVAFRQGTALLCIAALVVPMVGAIDITGLSVDGLTVTESETATSPAIGTDANPTLTKATWIGSGTTITGTLTPGYSTTTTEETDCNNNLQEKVTYYMSDAGSTTITLKNISGEKRLLSFDFTMPAEGSLKIGGTSYTTAGHYEKVLANNGTLAIVLTGRSLTGLAPKSQSDMTNYASKHEAKLTLSDIKLISGTNNVNVTFESVAAINGTETIPGSYTVKGDSTTLSVGSSYSKSVTTAYTLTATPKDNYIFTGWYLNDILVSDQLTLTDYFQEDTTVRATFAVDPLYVSAKLSEVAADGETEVVGTIDEYVGIWSEYTNTSRSYTTNPGLWNNTYGLRNDYFEDLAWLATSDGTGVGNTVTGHSKGDMQNEMGRSTVKAVVYSDVIRIKVKKNCDIVFDYDFSISIKSGSSKTNQTYLYYYISNSASDSVSTITSKGTKLVDAAASEKGTATIPVNEGKYLYIYGYGSASSEEYKSSGYAESDFTYSASITNLIVKPNLSSFKLDAGNRDDTGALLPSGTITVNGTAAKVSTTTADITTQSYVEASVLTLTPGTAPTGYVFIGWYDSVKEEYSYTDSYEVKLMQDTRIDAIYVPVMTVTAGANGYSDATYSYTTLSGAKVSYQSAEDSNARYVARNGDWSALYRTLDEGFDADGPVILLAGDTFTSNTVDAAFTIPEGETLVIPYGLDDTGSEEPTPVDVSTSLSGYYCTVNLVNCDLTIDGTLIVDAKQSSANGGRAAGRIGRLNVDGKSTILINGTLGAYGYVKSSGRITAASDSTVYELLEIKDVRAVLTLKDIAYDNKEEQVFPFSHFYINSIDGAVCYETDSSLTGKFAILLQGAQSGSIGELPLIAGSGAMFNLTKGTFTKSYDRSKDQVILRIDEGAEAATGTFSMDVSYEYFGQELTIPINTAEFYMPLEAFYNVEVAGDLVFNNKYKLLPGAVLNVTETGSMTIAKGADLIFYRLNDYDNRTPGTGTVYQGFSNIGGVANATRYPSETGYYTRKESTITSATGNFDGTLTVLGGLYVTTQAEGELPINSYTSGYDILTGTGTIDMSNAVAETEFIKEAMQCRASNTVEFANVTLIPIRGLTIDATNDTVTITEETEDEVTTITEESAYESLVKPDIYYGTKKTVDGKSFYVWATNRLEFWDGKQNEEAEDDELLYTALASSGDTTVETGVILNADGTVADTVTEPAVSGKLFKGWNTDETARIGDSTAAVLASAFENYDADDDLYAILNTIVANVDNVGVDYEGLRDALSSSETTSVSVQMQNSLTQSEGVTISRPVDLDLNGCDIPSVTIDGGTISGFDTITNGFLVADETGKTPVPGTIGVALTGVYSPAKGHAQYGRHYLAVPVYGPANSEGEKEVIGTQFHRVAASISAAQLYLKDPYAYLTLEGVFRGTEAGLGALTNLGFRVDGVDAEKSMFVGNAKDEEGNLYEIGQILPETLVNGGTTDPVHYTTAVNLDTDAQAWAEFGTVGKKVIAAPGYLHEDILSSILTAAQTHFGADSDEYKIIQHYIDGQSAG